VGKIDLNRRLLLLQRQLVNSKFRLSLPQKWTPKAKLRQKKLLKGSGKVVADKKEVKAVIETKEPVKSQ
jgi:hypothetical protein